MSRIFILIAVGLAGYLIYRLYFKKLLAQGRSGKIQIALITLGLLFIAMAAMLRAPAFFALIGAVLTQVMRIAPLLIKFAPSLAKAAGLEIPGLGTSTLKSNYIVLNLDSRSGKITGTVLAGQFNGRHLDELTSDELLQLYNDCIKSDPEAAQLLQTYIARERSEWSEGQQGHSAQSPQLDEELTIREACDILGVKKDASKQIIMDAYRILMRQLHPDKGGSNYLAAKVNAAKELLLKQRNAK